MLNLTEIDTHVHMLDVTNYPKDYAWAQQMSGVHQDFLIPDLQKELEGTEIGGVILVQARQSIEETEWLLRLAKENRLIRGVVGWFDLRSSDITDVLGQYTENPLLVGARHIIQAEADPLALMKDTNFNRGLEALVRRNLPYEVLIVQKNLAGVVELAKRHPGLTLVIDHMGKPTFTDNAPAEGVDSFKYWKEQMSRLSNLPNVYVKVSGGALETNPRNWKEEILKAYIVEVALLFGPERIMYGSNTPVLRDAYKNRLPDKVSATTKWYKMVKGYMEKNLVRFMGGNATRVYHLADRK